MEREQRRQEREALRRQKELERQAKEQTKLSAIARARLEVITYENQLDLLLSVHKEQGPVWDWTAIAATLPSPPPQRLTQHELRARQQACLAAPAQQTTAREAVSQARVLDDQDFQHAAADSAAESASLEKLKPLARRILAGDLKAYTNALAEFSPLAELSTLGSALHFTVHNKHIIECSLKVAALSIIPSEIKSLTASEKLSVKPMPRARLHELYQDHICSCILRVARETFALLPVEKVLVTASVDSRNPATGQAAEETVLSVAFTQNALASLDFEHLDPSDAVETFPHHGDFKASRKSGAFAPITPLTPADVCRAPDMVSDSADLLVRARGLRESIRGDLASLRAQPANET